MASLNVRDFIAGWIGGASGVVTSHALDTVKVRLQTSNTNKSTIDCAIQLFKSEGVRGFYRGMSFPLVSVAAYNAMVFGIYSNTNRILQAQTDGNIVRKPHYSEMIVSAMVAGALSTCIGSPVDLIKVKLQAQSLKVKKHTYVPKLQEKLLIEQYLLHTKSVASRHIATSRKTTVFTSRNSTNMISSSTVTYKGPVHCVTDIIKNKGLLGLYKGCPSMIIRDIPGYAIYFLPYEFLCQMFRKQDEVHTRPLGLIAAGGLAGVLSWGVMHPIDTIKSRIQAGGEKYSGFLDCLSKSVKNDGVSVLFRGLTVNALRGFPQSASLFLGYEMTMRLIH